MYQGDINNNIYDDNSKLGWNSPLGASSPLSDDGGQQNPSSLTSHPNNYNDGDAHNYNDSDGSYNNTATSSVSNNGGQQNSPSLKSHPDDYNDNSMISNAHNYNNTMSSYGRQPHSSCLKSHPTDYTYNNRSFNPHSHKDNSYNNKNTKSSPYLSNLASLQSEISSSASTPDDCVERGVVMEQSSPPSMLRLQAQSMLRKQAEKNKYGKKQQSSSRRGRSCRESDRSATPFSPREGKNLSWRNVTVTLTSGKLLSKTNNPASAKNHKKILDNVWGEVPQNEVTAVMGPSGAGKSSLLETLAGRLSSHGKIRVEDEIRLNNIIVNPRKNRIRKQIAYVAQDDSLQITSTPREAIRFSAKLRLPKKTKEEKIDILTSNILTELGLDKCADTMIGGSLIKGISGGERKRTSVGVELVVKPSLVFLDEPTSGLDSFSAVQLCQVLKKVAHAGASVCLTIHQPASEIFNSFDHLILMNKGRVMYQGGIKKVPSFFNERGYPVPPNFNPADWIMSVAQAVPLEKLTEDGFFPDGRQQLAAGITLSTSSVMSLDSSLTGGIGEQNKDAIPKKSHPTKVSTWVQIYLLLQRETRYMYRDTKQLLARLGLSLSMSLLIGSVFFKVGETDLSVPSHVQSLFGGLTLSLTQNLMGSALPALLTFPVERPVFLREYSTNHYSVISYFFSRLVVEAFITFAQMLVSCLIMYFMIGFNSNFTIFLSVSYALGMASTAMAVMLGALIEDPKLAFELVPVVFVPQFILSGFFVTPSLIPVWLRWARFVWPMGYSINILLRAEFDRDCGGVAANLYCGMVLESAEVDTDNTWFDWMMLIILFVVYRLSALIILQRKASKFL